MSLSLSLSLASLNANKRVLKSSSFVWLVLLLLFFYSCWCSQIISWQFKLIWLNLINDLLQNYDARKYKKKSDSILFKSKVYRGSPKKTHSNRYTWITVFFGPQANKLNCFFFGFNHELAPASTRQQQRNQTKSTKCTFHDYIDFCQCWLCFSFQLSRPLTLDTLSSIE